MKPSQPVYHSRAAWRSVYPRDSYFRRVRHIVLIGNRSFRLSPLAAIWFCRGDILKAFHKVTPELCRLLES